MDELCLAAVRVLDDGDPLVVPIGGERLGLERETRDYKILIGGGWVDALSEKTFESINPYTGRVWATAPEAGEEEVGQNVRNGAGASDALLRRAAL